MMPLLKLAKEYLELSEELYESTMERDVEGILSQEEKDLVSATKAKSEELQKEIKRLENVYRKFPG